MLDIHDIALEHSHVVLRPPISDDLNGLCHAATDGEIWKNPFTSFPTIEEMSIYLQNMIKHDNTSLPFVIVDKLLKTVVGTTRFFNIDHQNYRVEIGHTWIAKSYRRSPVNTEVKFLMLRYAFEDLNCIAIEIRTDVLNQVSRKAIERIGGKQDGILRNHKIMRNGRIRDTACYSIIKEEWPEVKKNLSSKLRN